MNRPKKYKIGSRWIYYTTNTEKYFDYIETKLIGQEDVTDRLEAKVQELEDGIKNALTAMGDYNETGDRYGEDYNILSELLK